MIIDKFDCEAYHIDGDIVLKVSVNETHWLEVTYDIYSEDWQITNLNTDKQYYVMMEKSKPVDCDLHIEFIIMKSVNTCLLSDTTLTRTTSQQLIQHQNK